MSCKSEMIFQMNLCWPALTPAARERHSHSRHKMGTLCQCSAPSLSTKVISVESPWWQGVDGESIVKLVKYIYFLTMFYNFLCKWLLLKGRVHKGWLAGLCSILTGGISGEPNRLAIITPGGLPHAERTPALTSKLWLLMRGVRLSQNAIFDSQENAGGYIQQLPSSAEPDATAKNTRVQSSG